MAVRLARYSHISLSLLIAAVIMGGRGDMAPRLLFQKLEDAFKTDNKTLYQMQGAFFPVQESPRDYVHFDMSVTIGSMPSCLGYSCSPDVQSTNFQYHQKFQWSRSPFLDLISNDQLLVMDNVLTRTVDNTIQCHSWLTVQLHIDSIPYNVSENDVLEALIQLLSWVCKHYVYNDLLSTYIEFVIIN